MSADFQPAIPEADGPGSSFINCRVSTRWPGLYTSRCRHCDAYFIAEKRAPRCDECEDARLDALGRIAPTTEADQIRVITDRVRIAQLTTALTALVERHVQVASYAYGAIYDPEREPAVIEAREALKGAKK